MNLQSKYDIHVCIIWNSAFIYRDDIEKMMSESFDILKCYEIHWTKSNFGKNLTSLYEENFLYDRHQQIVRGTGEFLMYVVNDPTPEYRMQRTRRGMELVNEKAFRIKERIRNELTKTFNFHTSINELETRSNLVKLLGISLEDFIHNVPFSKNKEVLYRDCTGVNGWNSLEEFFYTINETTRYVVLRNYDEIPHNHTMKKNGDIDILVDNLPQFLFVINQNAHIIENAYQFFNWLEIGDDRILIHVKYLGDNYYDRIIENRLLSRRVKNSNGIFIPDSETFFWSILYHGLFHKDSYSKYYSLLDKIGKQIGIQVIDDKEYLCNILSDYLRYNGCKCKMHLDSGAAHLQPQNFRGPNLLGSDFYFYVFENAYSKVIIWEKLIYDNPRLFTRIVSQYDSLFCLENHVLAEVNENHLYRKRAELWEYMWKYSVRGDDIQEMVYHHEPNQQPYFTKELLSGNNSIQIESIVYSNENKNYWIEGKPLDLVWKEAFFSRDEDRINILIKELINYFNFVFNLYGVTDGKLSGKAWDAKPQNCFYTEDGEYKLFDFEAVSEDLVSKQFLIRKCVGEMSQIDFLELSAEEQRTIIDNLYDYFDLIEDNSFDNQKSIVDRILYNNQNPFNLIKGTAMCDDDMVIARKDYMEKDNTIYNLTSIIEKDREEKDNLNRQISELRIELDNFNNKRMVKILKKLKCLK